MSHARKSSTSESALSDDFPHITFGPSLHEHKVHHWCRPADPKCGVKHPRQKFTSWFNWHMCCLTNGPTEHARVHLVNATCRGNSISKLPLFDWSSDEASEYRYSYHNRLIVKHTIPRTNILAQRNNSTWILHSHTLLTCIEEQLLLTALILIR